MQVTQDKRNFTQAEGLPSTDHLRQTVANEKLNQLEKITKEYYHTIQANAASQTVKQHSFRALGNLDSNNTDLFGAMQERRKNSIINNSSSLKFSS